MVTVKDTESELVTDARAIKDVLPGLERDQREIEGLRSEVEEGIDLEELDAKAVAIYNELLADGNRVLNPSPGQVPTIPSDVAARLAAQRFLNVGDTQ